MFSFAGGLERKDESFAAALPDRLDRYYFKKTVLLLLGQFLGVLLGIELAQCIGVMNELDGIPFKFLADE